MGDGRSSPGGDDDWQLRVQGAREAHQNRVVHAMGAGRGQFVSGAAVRVPGQSGDDLRGIHRVRGLCRRVLASAGHATGQIRARGDPRDRYEFLSGSLEPDCGSHSVPGACVAIIDIR